MRLTVVICFADGRSSQENRIARSTTEESAHRLLRLRFARHPLPGELPDDEGE
jgi:hypothetical protein